MSGEKLAECMLAVRAAASGMTRIHCELEKLKDMAETGKIDKKRLDESLERLSSGRAAVMADATLESLSKCTCTPVDKLEKAVEPLLFEEWYVEPEPLKRQVEERRRATEHVWDELTKLLAKPCER
jgi:GTPase Era involved in 16S rRNA processing